MSVEFELGRKYSERNRELPDLRQRSREAATLLGCPEIERTRGNPLPTYNEIKQARESAINSMGRNRDNFCLGDFAKGLFGDDWASLIAKPTHALEAEDALDVSFFRNITGQLLITWLKEAYADPEFVGDMLMETRQAPSPWNLGTEIIPKISSVQQGPSLIMPGMPYPHAQMIQDYTTDPAIGKWGGMLNLTLESVGTDRTGQMGDTARKLGFRQRYNKEAQQLAVAMGITVTIDGYSFNGNNFSWLGTGYNTYTASGANWINEKSGVTVSGNYYVILSNLENLFAGILDPYSGIVVEQKLAGMKILCPFQSRYTFREIRDATGVRSGAFATTSPNYQTETPNPLDQAYEVLPSKIAYQLLLSSGISASDAINHFWLAQWAKAFHYREVLPWEIITRPPMNDADYNQDIVLSLKTRRMGTPGVTDPRYAAHSYGA